MNQDNLHNNSQSLNDDSQSGSEKQYRFDIVDGTVTALFEVENGIIERESLDSRDSFEIGNGLITHTKTTSNGLETTVFSDPDGDGFYTILSETNPDSSTDDRNDDNSSGRDNHKAFVFDIENGQVTAVSELKDGVLKSKSIDSDDIYTLDGSDVIHTEIKDSGSEITRYADADGDGQFLRVSEQWVASPDSTANGPSPVIGETLRFFHSDSDDFIAVRDGQISSGGLGSDSFVLRDAAHLYIEDFKSDEDDLLVFDTGLGLRSKEHLASFISEISHDGQNLIIDFTPSVSITLMGVSPDQISWDDVSVLS